jgi:hypothetical protein
VIGNYRREVVASVHGSADYPQTGLVSAVRDVGSPLTVWKCTSRWAEGVELGYHRAREEGKKDGNPNSRRTKEVEGESYLRLWLRVVGGTSKKSVEDM